MKSVIDLTNREETMQLSRLIDMEDPHAVLDEVKTIVSMLFSSSDFGTLDLVFTDIVRLFQGKYPGYSSCRTQYHDLKHTTDTFLAMARLIHGATLSGEQITSDQVTLGLVCSLMHDTGYIQRTDEHQREMIHETLTDVRRSISFMDQYESDHGLSPDVFRHSSAIITCTDLSAKITEIDFPSREIELLGKLIGTADLLGQMADRTYLEKLLFLFYEFREGGVMGYKSELDLLRKTRDFYGMSRKRIAKDLDVVNEYMRNHFKVRWNLDRDLYLEALERHMAYLIYILKNHEKDYRRHLRRGGLVERLEKSVNKS
jgi:hypothetical protein